MVQSSRETYDLRPRTEARLTMLRRPSVAGVPNPRRDAMHQSARRRPASARCALASECVA